MMEHPLGGSDMRALVILALAGCVASSQFEIRTPGATVVHRAPGTDQRLYDLLPVRTAPTGDPFCLDGLTAALAIEPYLTNGPRLGEAHLFAQNIASVTSALRGMNDVAMKDGTWDGVITRGLTDPAIRVLPFPLAGQIDLTTFATTALASSQFYSSLPSSSSPAMPLNCIRADQNNAAAATGTLVTGVVYHRGLCSQDIVLGGDGGLLAQVVDGFWAKFRDNSDLGNPTEDFTKAASILTVITPTGQGDPAGTSDFTTAFLLGFRWSADAAGTGRTIWGLYQYNFGFLGGTFSLAPEEINLQSSSWDPNSGPLSVISGVRNGLKNDLPNTVVATLAAAQMRTLPGAGSCSVVSDCVNTINSISGNLTIANAASAGFGTIGFGEINQMKCAIGDSAGCQALGVPTNLGNTWACNNNQCQVQLHVKRVNFMGDEIEAVLYDGAEFQRTAVALRVAAEGLPAAQKQAAVSALCASQVQTAPFNRRFASVSRAGRHR
jgi:hypothetical protein